MSLVLSKWFLQGLDYMSKKADQLTIITESEIKNATIIIVDDMDFNVIIIDKLLRDNGYKNIHVAKNGLEALKLTKELDPDVVVLDLVMPEMDGFEYCKKIREEERFASMPIVVQTSINLPKQKNFAFTCGATDFINKPIDAQEMIARINVHVENHIMLKKLRSFQERLHMELELAQRMQNALMPSVKDIGVLKSKYNIDCYNYFKTSSELGGDFWSFKPINDNSCSINITDFSGHGIGASINTFRMHDILVNEGKNLLNPASLLSEINSVFVELLPPGQFCTMMYGVIDVEANQFTYAAAASTNIFLIDIDSKVVNILSGVGFPIGVDKKSNFMNINVEFKKNAAILVYSDAFIETNDEIGNTLSETDIKTMIEDLMKNSNFTISDLYNKIISNFNDKYSKNLKDDLTICMYHRL